MVFERDPSSDSKLAGLLKLATTGFKCIKMLSKTCDRKAWIWCTARGLNDCLRGLRDKRVREALM